MHKFFRIYSAPLLSFSYSANSNLISEIYKRRDSYTSNVVDWEKLFALDGQIVPTEEGDSSG